MHVQAPVQMIQTILLKILVEERAAIHVRIDSIVTYNIGIKFEALTASCVVLSVRTITSPWICSAHLVHMHILMHHSIGSVR